MLSRIKQFLTSILNAANHDFCPDLNRYVYWLKAPIGWVVTAMLFSILIGVFVGQQGYVLAVAFFALLVLGLVWPWLSMKGIQCSLVLPNAQMKENESTEIIFKVRNYWPLPVFGLIVEGDFLQDIDANEEPIAFSLKRIGAFSETDFPISVTPRRRGLLPCGEVKVKNGFPFGLADVSKAVPETSKTLVWPARHSLEGNPPSDDTRFNLIGALSDRSGNDGETIGVRSYREGDRMRNIHWAQTIRAQRLMVRERQTPSATIATVLLDLTADHHTGEGINNSFEWAIRIAASICEKLHRAQSSVRLICRGLPEGSQQAVNNHQGIDDIMDFLSRLPTLQMLRELSQIEGAKMGNENWSGAGQTFFVCTSLSNFSIQLGSDVEPVMIDLAGFEAAQGEPAIHLPGNSRHTRDFEITTPQLAPSQLAFAWNRSYGSAPG